MPHFDRNFRNRIEDILSAADRGDNPKGIADQILDEALTWLVVRAASPQEKDKEAEEANTLKRIAEALQEHVRDSHLSEQQRRDGKESTMTEIVGPW